MPRKKAPDLGKLADEANDALNFLYSEGYVEQIDAIRNFITAQGENFRAMMKIQHNIALELSNRLKKAGKSVDEQA